MAQVSYLLSFVKSLIENDNFVVQEEKKKQLESEYGINGASLNKNLADKYEQVSQILQVYRYISERVKQNKIGVNIIKNNLTQCKQLLQCNREDLRRLWLELVEKRHCVKLLEALEDVRLAPELVSSLTENRQWIDAALTVNAAEKKLSSGLERVDGVHAIRSDLSVRHKTLIERLKSELHKLIFKDVLTYSLKNVNFFGDRKTSYRNAKKSAVRTSFVEVANDSDVVILPPPFNNLSLSNWSTIKIDNEFWSDRAENFDIQSVSKIIPTSNDGKSSNESKHAYDIVSVITSLYQFNKLQDVLDNWTSSSNVPWSSIADDYSDSNFVLPDKMGFIRRELNKSIIMKAIEHIKRSAIGQNDVRLENFEDCRYLLDLLELLYFTLFQCQSALLLMHRTVNYLVNSRKTNLSRQQPEDLHMDFDETTIRTMIQNELQSLLTVHLTISGKHRLLDRVAKFENGFQVPDPDFLRQHMGKKKGFLSGIQPNIQSTQTTTTNTVSIGSADHYLHHSSAQQSKTTLFKFAHSSHALSVNACLQELRPATANADDIDGTTASTANISMDINQQSSYSYSYPHVCKPHHNNITKIYSSVMGFIEAIELEEWRSSQQQKNSANKIRTIAKPCLLREFVHNFIQNVFLKESLMEMNSQLNSSFKEQGAVKGLQNLVSQADERELGLQRPIIAIMVTADHCLEEVKKITSALPHYAIHSLRNGYRIMDDFKNNLFLWFKELSSSDHIKDPHLSIEWGKDEDLIRFWKGMPSWQAMNNIDAGENLYGIDYANMHLPLSLSSDGLQSPGIHVFSKQFKIISGTSETNNVSLLKEREARLLVNEESKHVLRLIDDEIKSEKATVKSAENYTTFVTFEKNDLIKQIARLHESVAWFAQRTYRFQTWLTDKSWLNHNGSQTITMTENEIIDLNKVMKDFSNLTSELNHLSDACLLSIHLEGRLRAYNYIIQIPYKVNYGIQLDEVDADPQISELIKSLNDMEFVLNHSLTRHKFRFIFEGLGNFMSALFVQILPKIKIMYSSGIKKMCRNIYLIQQTLSALTQSHEMDLVRVKQLYELLHISPENVVNKIMEEGAVYEEDVYRSVLNLYQQSRPFYDNEKLRIALNRLSELFNTEYV